MNLKNLLSLGYFLDILEGKKSFKLFLATLVLALLLTIKPSYEVFQNIYPLVKGLDKKIEDTIIEVYPEELVVTIKNGTAKSNVTEPYYITMRKETLEKLFSYQKDSGITRSKIRLLAVDTKAKAEDFERYQSLALLTENSLVTYRDGDIEIYPLRDIGDMTVNKEFVLSKYKEFEFLPRAATWLVLSSPLFIFLVHLIGQYIAYLLISFLVYLMVKIKNLTFGFKKTFMYTSSLTLVLNYIWSALSFIPFLSMSLFMMPTLFTIIILAISYKGLVVIGSRPLSQAPESLPIQPQTT